MQCLTSDLFKDFPTLKFLIPHGGGAVPYHWGRFRGLAQEMKKPLLQDHLLNNIFFDTCVYHQPGIDLLTKVIPVKNVLFASEMIGAVRGIDPRPATTTTTPSATSTGRGLSDEDRFQIFEGNARRSTRAWTPPSNRKDCNHDHSHMNQLGIVKRNIERADRAPWNAWPASAAPPCTRPWAGFGLMKPYMRPIYAGAQVGGTAVTVLLHPGDNWMLHVAAEQIQPGDIVVAALTAECTDGFFGDLLATSFMARGAKALIIDAGVRDVRVLKEMGFPVWSKAISAKGTIKATLGSVNIPVICAGAFVNPGDA
jgi:4-hydroxy-4-methyl-2-oxoglutarate aldolase